MNLQEDSDDISAHSADTDDSEFIKCTEKPLNCFNNQIILQIGPDENNIYEEIFPRMFRRTITKLIFGVPQIISIFKEYMNPKRTNCIFCPESIMNTIQIVYRNYFHRCKNFKIFISQKLLIDLKTPEEQNLIIQQTHDSAHRGIWENLKKISNRFFFPRMKFLIRQHIKLCQTCNKNKYDRHPYNLIIGTTPISNRPFEIINIDIFISKPCLFQSVIDKFSRFGILQPIKSRTINDIRKGLLKIFAIYGSPKQIVCDNEPALKSIEIRGLMQNLGIEVYYIPANHSESNGMVERFHSTIAEIFRCTKPQYPDLNDKEVFLIFCTLYNNTIHSTTEHKPREIFFGLKDGQERPLNIDQMVKEKNKFYQEISEVNKKTQTKDLNYHNKKREQPPQIQEDSEAFKRVQGIKRKTKEMYLPVRIIQNNDNIATDDSGREIHKENIKRI